MRPAHSTSLAERALDRLRSVLPAGGPGRPRAWAVAALAALIVLLGAAVAVGGEGDGGGPGDRAAAGGDGKDDGGRGDGDGRGGKDGQAGGGGVTTTAVDEPPVSTETTYALLPVTSGVPIPTVPTTAPAPPPTAAPAPVPAAGVLTAGPPALGAQGALLAAPAAPVPRTIDKAKGCYSAVDPGWRVVQCGALKTKGTVLLWVVEARDKGLRALVVREVTPGQWAVVLAAADDDGSDWSSIGVRAEDLSGDGHPDLAFGFHRRTPDKVLAVDVVDAPGTVVLHHEVAGGVAQLAAGELALWQVLPDRAERLVVKFDGTAWRLVATTP
ncbi:MAG TPA: hypothetical protein VFO65_04860, partial [Acidimicrobiales bacterium]|nr:hypothetical protein [Acidimicrobiales bacterium]